MSLLKHNKKMVLLISVLIAALVVLLSFALKKEEAVAKINGEAISKDALYNEMVEQYGAATVDQIIADKIVAAEAKKQKLI